MKRIFKITALSIVLLLVAPLYADEAEIAGLKKILKEEMPQLEITDVRASPVAGLYELQAGGDIVYLTPDAKYMFQGALIDLDERVNLTQARKGEIHMELISAVPENRMVVFKPEKPDSIRQITVFTDTSCPYCTKLHNQVNELNDAGIAVRYLLYPRAGMGSPAYRELQSVWCAEDQLQAMTDAKNGITIDEKTCENPIAEHIALAHEVGLRGTPLIYLDTGEIVNGYRPAEDIIKLIEHSEPL